MIGLVIGLFIGAILGFLACGFVVANSEAEKQEHWPYGGPAGGGKSYGIMGIDPDDLIDPDAEWDDDEWDEDVEDDE